MTRHGKSSQDETRPVKSRQVKATKVKSRQRTASQVKSSQVKSSQVKTRQDKRRATENETKTYNGTNNTAYIVGLKQASGPYLDLVGRLVAVLRHVRVEQRADEEDLLRLDLDVRRLPLGPSQRLVDHDARVRQRSALALWIGRGRETATVAAIFRCNGTKQVVEIVGWDMRATVGGVAYLGRAPSAVVH